MQLIISILLKTNFNVEILAFSIVNLTRSASGQQAIGSEAWFSMLLLIEKLIWYENIVQHQLKVNRKINWEHLKIIFT